MPVTHGTAIAWGVSPTNLTGFTAAVSGGYNFSGSDYARESDKSQIKNGLGEVVTEYLYNGRETLSIKAYFAGSGASRTSIPTVGETVTVAAANDANIAGNWLVDGVTKSESNESHVTFDLSLSKADGITY